MRLAFHNEKYCSKLFCSKRESYSCSINVSPCDETFIICACTTITGCFNPAKRCFNILLLRSTPIVSYLGCNFHSYSQLSHYTNHCYSSALLDVLFYHSLHNIDNAPNRKTSPGLTTPWRSVNDKCLAAISRIVDTFTYYL